MDLTFKLNNTVLIEIDGEEMSTAGGKQLYIGGAHGPSILAQMKDHYNDEQMKDIAAALDLALRLRLGAFNDVTASSFVDDMVVIANMLLSSSDVTLPRVRADLEKIKSIGEGPQTPATGQPTAA